MPQPGSVIGGYCIESSVDIGKGGFGKVYRARSLQSGAVVALKLVSLNNDDAVAAERTGAKLQQRFMRTHGLVPEVFAFGDDRHYDCFYIAMEFVAAPTLSALLHHRPLAPEEAARHAIGICQFLEKAHSFEAEIDGERFPRIVHGDLKPANVFVLGDGTIKVLDFGISKALEQTRAVKTITFVTPPYASPERLETGHGSEQDDRWAVGVMVHEMISGHRPHFRLEDPPLFRALSNAIQRNVPREALPPSCPIELAAIVNKLLAFQPELRYPSASAVRSDLEAFLRGESPTALAQYDTALTIGVPWARAAGATRTTAAAAIVPTAAQSSAAKAVLTLPRPVDVSLPAPRAATVVDTTVPVARSIRRAGVYVRRGAWLAALLVLSGMFTSEAVAWMGAERMRTALSSLELRTIAARRQDYHRLRHWSPFAMGVRVRLNRPLKDRLVSLADDVLADYRQEEQTVAEAQWRQAADALAWAAEIAPRDTQLMPRALDCQGHLDRIAGQGLLRTSPLEAHRLFNRAIDAFQRAAGMSPQSADPYLGLSRIYIYGLANFELGTAAIQEAEQRGHKPGWREQAQIGDGYRLRADAAFNRSRRLAGDARRDTLEHARDDYARCVDSLSGILDKGQAKYNHDYCQQRAEHTAVLLVPQL